jgi:HlyD family secretion protein
MLHSVAAMDIARPDLKRKRRRRQALVASIGVAAIVLTTIGVYRLKPAAPTVERGTVWMDTVKRGPMLRQVRGLGTLVPDEIRQIPAETEATVVRIRMLPGTQVKANTVLLEMSNPQLQQEALDAELQVKAAQAEYQNLKVKLQSDLMNQKASAATVSTDFKAAQRQAKTDKALYEMGVISGMANNTSQEKADELTTRNGLEQERIAINEKSIESQLAVQQTKVDEMQALADLKKKRLEALNVRAGIDGVLTDLPLQVGQHVVPGTMLAKVAQPEHLKAELKIAETQARDIQIGQPAAVDTHNGVISGKVMRIDPAVQNGTVTVDVHLDGELPKGARPDLSVDGTIDLDRLGNVLFVGRPAFGNEESTISLFKLDPDGHGATRVPVKVGRASVNSIQIIEGLNEGDAVILSDMSRWDNTDRIRLE